MYTCSHAHMQHTLLALAGQTRTKTMFSVWVDGYLLKDLRCTYKSETSIGTGMSYKPLGTDWNTLTAHELFGEQTLLSGRSHGRPITTCIIHA